ncbi:GGDEF domain-containing protein [Marinomonas mediterranea]|uniref:diguanylate cyclase n=1 Tax=Marinomonas mediterranea (strain ATCC 700492 / JCM 21426 / NBRC 103028 / MMB-1) TaxID=717774 RepID=F2K0M7_MARM1|nr:GGDEF domain-containing protein [Marinomonas mediterranea]ADZ91011.1 diguanylate cyclase [Marinomonas mediterranea MMB-1]WCN09048.1 diguanylate cyclase [Marinomonas mediterranea]WCN13080.1 diguanylate cyclase [Marinomonas mediterranea]WCN17150.1 diguanylate cyclase [Marinomonas mediterranea MMB-1]
MLTRIPTYLEQLLSIGSEHETGIELSQRQAVNLACLLCGLVCFVLFVAFAWVGVSTIAFFNFVGLTISLLGLWVTAKGLLHITQLVLPFLAMFFIAFSCLFFYGADSHFHWMLATVGAYTFTAFRSAQWMMQISLFTLAVFLFFLCETLGAQFGPYLLEGQQPLFSILSFVVAIGVVAIVTNHVVGRLRTLNKSLQDLAEKDELTGLSNRRKVLADAVNVFADSIINYEPCAMAIADLDHFKRINDTYGHDAGDTVLKAVASEMLRQLPSEVKVGRYGGEEFIFVMPSTNLNDATSEMEHLREVIESLEISTPNGIVIPVTISIGVASLDSDTSRYEEIITQADKALYQAKDNGRNRVVGPSAYFHA